MLTVFSKHRNPSGLKSLDNKLVVAVGKEPERYFLEVVLKNATVFKTFLFL